MRYIRWMEESFSQTLNDEKSGGKEEKSEKKLCLRKVNYRDEKGGFYEFITNNKDIHQASQKQK